MRLANVLSRRLSSTAASASRRFSSVGTIAQAVAIDLAQARAKAKIAEIDSYRPFSPALVDNYARRHNYLRISLTERCNLRCFYCMPEEGIDLSPKNYIMSDDEVIRIATLFVKSGVTKIRLTGGEPTVRKGIVDIVGRLNELRQYGLESIGITSNGLILHRLLPDLVRNGLTHVNLSLDTLDPFKFEIMTRRRGHEAVLRTLDKALSMPELQTKLNAVVMKGLNDHEVLKFVELTRDKPLSVRFIEFMPFTGNKWDSTKMVPSSTLLEQIQARYPGIAKALDEPNDTARSYRIPEYTGSFGFISSMSDHFCGTCNRLRLTADGQIKVCLFDAKEISLRDRIRTGASDDDLLQIINAAVKGKAEKHAFMDDIDVVTNRPMILIGGLGSDVTIKKRGTFARSTSLSRTARARHHRATSNKLHLLAPLCTTLGTRYFSTSATRCSHQPSNLPSRLTHIDPITGRPSMVDVSAKVPSTRTATAQGRILLPLAAFELVASTSSTTRPMDPKLERAQAKARTKGDVLVVAQLAGIMAAKRTADLIPLCHPLALSYVTVVLTPEPVTSNHDDDGESLPSVLCEATVSCEGKTGVEMEALTAVSAALLTVWDMLKAVAGREMIITDLLVSHKSGGKSGDFNRTVV